MNKVWWLLAICWPLTAAAQMQLVADSQAQAVFAGSTQIVRVVLHNAGDAPASRDVDMRLVQLTAASAVSIGDARPWKKIDLLPRQTVLETMAVAFPEVRAATGFGVELVGIGRVRVTAWPHDVLQRLKTLAGDVPLGVFDPNGQLKTLLKQASVAMADFEIEPTDSKLAIVWSNGRNLPESVKSRVTKGMSAVWIRSSTVPTSYAVRIGAGVIVVAPESTIRGLADSPLPQLTLIRDAELALQPEALRLPSDNQTE
jgi:hypothetical protein